MQKDVERPLLCGSFMSAKIIERTEWKTDVGSFMAQAIPVQSMVHEADIPAILITSIGVKQVRQRAFHSSRRHPRMLSENAQSHWSPFAFTPYVESPAFVLHIRRRHAKRVSWVIELERKPISLERADVGSLVANWVEAGDHEAEMPLRRAQGRPNASVE